MMPIISLLDLPVELLFMIIHCCCAPSLLRLRATCHFFDVLIAKEFPLRQRLVLSQFVDNVLGLLRELTVSGSLVTGSGALWANNEPHCFPLLDLDIVCGVHMSFHVVGYLHRIAGYVVVRLFGPSVDGNTQGGVRSVIRLSNGIKTIDIIQSQTPSAMYPLFYFWSSIPMCFFNEHSFYIAYPRLLERYYAILNPARLVTKPLPDLLSKYIKRGFEIHVSKASLLTDAERQSHICRMNQSPACPQTKRAVGDKWGLQTRLGTVQERMGQPVFVSPLADWTIVWQRGGHPCGALCAAYEGFSIPTIFVAPVVAWV